MSPTSAVRQSHRWISIAFTATVVANFVARGLRPGEPPAWITYSPLPPLALLLLSGLYLFAVPYVARRGASRSLRASGSDAAGLAE
jgi:hypothetical protein